jgi:nuclear pore complex protein Nup205
MHSPSLKQKLLACLLGTTSTDDGLVENASIFDLFDFMDLELNSPEKPEVLGDWLNGIDLDVCREISDADLHMYNLSKMKDLLLLRRIEFYRSRSIPPTAQEETDINKQITDVIEFHAVDNQVKLIWASRLRLLQSWTQLTLLMIRTSEFEDPAKISFLLRTLQTILPWLENNLSNDQEAVQLSKLAKCLLFALNFDSSSFKQGDIMDMVSERLFVLFQLSLRAIISIGAHSTLKENFYSIIYRYLTGMADLSGISGFHRRPSIQTIRAAGDRFIEIVCDDAYASEPMCRISALLLLSALVKMATHENVTDVIDSLARLNFIAILVDSIQNLPTDLIETAQQGEQSCKQSLRYISQHSTDVLLQLSYCHARLVLLLHLSQTRYGATAVLNSGLFHSIQASGLFATDPDLGVGKLNASLSIPGLLPTLCPFLGLLLTRAWFRYRSQRCNKAAFRPVSSRYESHLRSCFEPWIAKRVYSRPGSQISHGESTLYHGSTQEISRSWRRKKQCVHRRRSG